MFNTHSTQSNKRTNRIQKKEGELNLELQFKYIEQFLLFPLNLHIPSLGRPLHVLIFFFYSDFAISFLFDFIFVAIVL